MNRGHDYTSRVEAPDDGLALVDYLAARFGHSTASAWEARIVAGLVLVDGSRARRETLLRRGQQVVWSRPGWDEPAVPGTFTILHEDDDLLAVAKPAGLPTLPGAGFLEGTLLSLVRAVDPAASPVHRLGRWTSGIVLFARNPDARASLARQLAAREVRKRYRALAVGRPEADAFEVSVSIGPVPHLLLGTVHGASPHGRSARTRVRVVDRRADTFLCDAVIETGRPHQIRIHLAAAGHPLAGDPLYPAGGVPAPDCGALPGDPGYALHATEIGFRHPRSDDVIVVACAAPPALDVAAGAR